MNRRDVLVSTGSLTVATIAGCMNLASGTSEDCHCGSRGPPKSLNIYNTDTVQRTVTVSVTPLEGAGDQPPETVPQRGKPEQAPLPQTLTIDPDDDRWVENIVTKAGRYDIRAESAGQRKTWTAGTNQCGDGLFQLTIKPEKMVRETLPCY